MNDRKCIMLPPFGKPLIINFSDRYNYIDKVTDHRTPYWLDNVGYKLAIICSDISFHQPLNILATQIGKTELHGNCILVDDDRDLDYNELNTILGLCKNYEKIDGYYQPLKNKI